MIKTNIEQRHERQTPFLKEQMRLYLETVEVASEIAFPATSSNLENLKARFWQLYWGALAVVEDQIVINAMKEYGKSLKQSPNGGESLKFASISLAHACRDSLQKYWVVDLGEFDQQKGE